MKRILSGFLHFLVFAACSLVSAAANVSGSGALEGDEYVGPVVRIKRFHEYSKMVVPDSFQGRRGKATLEGHSIALFDRIEFRRDEVRTRLKGIVSKFDFDTDVDTLQGMLWRSRAELPGRNSCMDCHAQSDSSARTQLWIGKETRYIDPYPSVRGNATIEFADADTDKSFWELRHWVSHHQRISAGASNGRMRSFQTVQKAKSAWLGWSWFNHRDLNAAAEWRSSKPELYQLRHEFTGSLRYKAGKRLQLGVKGGVLMNGVGHYDLGFSDLGAVSVSTELYAPDTLPSIYNTLKNEKFGYYSIEARYEYAF